MNKVHFRSIWVIVFSVSAIACSRQKHVENGLEFRDWLVVRPIVPGGGTVAYGSIRNTSALPRTLSKVEFSCAESSDLHETLTDGGRARMVPLGRPVIGPGETLLFEPGHKHVMVMGTKADLGKTCDAVFTLEAISARFGVPVREREK